MIMRFLAPTIRWIVGLIMIGSIAHVTSYVVGGDGPANSHGAILSRFANVQCQLLMTVGRTPNTNMRK